MSATNVLIILVNRDWALIVFVNREWALIFFVNHEQYPPPPLKTLL